MKCTQCGYETMSFFYFHEHLYTHVAEEINAKVEKAKREAAVRFLEDECGCIPVGKVVITCPK